MEKLRLKNIFIYIFIGLYFLLTSGLNGYALCNADAASLSLNHKPECQCCVKLAADLAKFVNSKNGAVVVSNSCGCVKEPVLPDNQQNNTIYNINTNILYDITDNSVYQVINLKNIIKCRNNKSDFLLCSNNLDILKTVRLLI